MVLTPPGGPDYRPHVPSIDATLGRLERVKGDFGPEVAQEKADLLGVLGAARFRTPALLARFHEVLCFLRAYPDDAAVLAHVERLLDHFDRRPDMRRHRRALADSGIAGTATRFRFFHPAAAWLAGRWGRRLSVDWPAFVQADRLDAVLGFLTLPGEGPALDDYDLGARGWVERLKGPGETDAAFLLRRVAALPVDDGVREALYDALDPPLVLAPGPDTPSRTRAVHTPSEIVFATAPVDRSRPDLVREARTGRLDLREAADSEAVALLDLARAAMAVRRRDLDAFSHGSADDVRVAAADGGLAFALYGLRPERRRVLEAEYGYLILENGVPIGYGSLTGGLFRTCSVAYNVFETFRGGEAARILARLLALARTVLGSRTFVVSPYQIGEDNDEALRSGAFWFYAKLGFRPVDTDVAALLDAERARMKARPGHRSDIRTLKRLATSALVLEAGPRGAAAPSLGGVGLAVADLVARRFGADRERAARVLAREATARLGLDGTWVRALDRNERTAWTRWAPLVAVLPHVERWSAAERRALAEVAQAKGSRRESDFVLAFDAHPRLGRGLRSLAAAHSA